MRKPISDDVRRFVLASVPSVPFLEAMLLMRANASACWGATEVARRLYVAAPLGEALLTQLSEAGLVTAGNEPGTWCWKADSPMAPTIAELAVIYSENVIGVTELIHSRERRAHQFADAFRLRKKED